MEMNNKNSSHNKTNPFSVPQGYFEGFHDNLMDTLSKNAHNPGSTTHHTRKILSQRIIQWSCAAAILLLISLGVTYMVYEETPQSDSIYAKTYESEEIMIEDFINNYPIDEYALYCYLTGNESEY